MKFSVLASLLGGAANLATASWYSDIDHTSAVRGYAPDLDGDYNYPVYKAVTPGDGAGIQSAINAGTLPNTQRHGQWFASQPRVVYIPPGIYTVSKPIDMNTDTILMGDAANPPTIKASSNFQGQRLINGRDPSITEGRGELSFTVGLKNVILDTTAISATTEFTALFWGVAQGSHLQNVKIQLPLLPLNQNTGHTGIRLERGSTLSVSDVRIEGGQNGIWHHGHQQALYKSIYFYSNRVGLLIDGGATISIANPTFQLVGTGVLHTGGYPWISLIDATSINSGVTLKTTSWPSLLVENLSKDTTSDIIQGPGDHVLTGRNFVSQYSYGNTIDRSPIYGSVSSPLTRPASLTPTPGNKYLYLPAPNYATLSSSSFLNVKDPLQNGGRTILGDSTIDESATLNAILLLAAQTSKVAYFPFGKYRVDSTLHIPPNSRIVGEAWATITGSGAYFKDASSPKPIVQVGDPGSVGTAHIQDMRFTVSDVLPGAIILQINMASPASAPGSVAIWNSLVTVGGTRGASALTDTCTSPSSQCRGAFLGIHLAPSSSAYLENIWNWVADHTAEDFSGGSSIAAKGGMLVESTKPTYLHAIGSEHWWLYQLNLRNASNVVITLLQSETNYDQGDNNPQLPPSPWTAEVSQWGDPDFNGICSGAARPARCRMGFANYVNGGSNIFTYASASWAFFSGPGYHACEGGMGTYKCQQVMHWVERTPGNLQAFGLCSKDSAAVVRLGDGRVMSAQPDYTGGWDGGGGLVGRWTPGV